MFTLRSPSAVGLQVVVSFLLSLLVGCATVAPRLPLDVQRAVNRDEMRVLHTQTIDLYYPVKRKEQAYDFARRAEGCIDPLRRRALGRGGLSTKRFEIIFPDLPYNNAFEHPPANGDFFALIPTYWSFDATTETGLLPEPGFVACHELTHYIQTQQTLRSLGLLNIAFGSLVTPQLGLDAWFWEGVAVYYEEALQKGMGRPAWPAWRGMFHAAVAGRHLTGGDLDALNRKLHWGNHYLYGSNFIDYLVNTYGEFKLWQLIQVQGESFFYPFIVNQRFRKVYGKKLSHLLDEFAAYLKQAYPVRTRPAGQRVVRASIGMNGRLARAPDGTEAFVSDAMDEPPTLTVYKPNGKLLYRSRLTDVLPKRKLVTPQSRFVSGLRFSRDGRKLYLVAVDKGTVFLETRLLQLDLETLHVRQLAKDIGGIGGDVSPDGRSYVFVRTTGEGHALYTFDLQTGRSRRLHSLPPRTYLTSPSFSPDGSQIVAGLADGTYSVALFDARSGERTATLTDAAGPLSDPTFIDDDRLLLLGTHQQRFQVFVYRLSTRTATRISDVPYLAQQPRASGQTVRFLNREGFGYSLDEIGLPDADSTTGRTTASTFLFAPRTLADTREEGEPPAAQTPTSEPAPALDFSGTVLPPPPAAEAADAQRAPAPPVLSTGDLTLTITPGVAATRRPLGRPLTVVRDEPYAVFPRLLIPSVREPLVGASTASGANSVGLYLGGTDALGRHRWGGSGGVQWNTGLLSGAVGYLNSQGAPFQWLLNASQTNYDDRTYKKDSSTDNQRHLVHDHRRQRDLSFAAMLTLRTSQLSLVLHSTQDRRYEVTYPQLLNRTFSGASLYFSHQAVESTPMSGLRRGFATNLHASYYPESLGTLTSDLVDLRGSLEVYSPLLFSRRHTLNLGLRARAALDGGGSNSKLLEIGGTQGSATLFGAPDKPDSSNLTPGVVPSRRLRESLRGFETVPFIVRQIGIIDLTYRYPIIIDSGTATTFAVLPSFFLRQIDLEVFANGSADAVRDLRRVGHLALGGAVSATLIWGFVEIILGYQLAQRFTDGRRLQHLLTLGTPLAL